MKGKDGLYKSRLFKRNFLQIVIVPIIIILIFGFFSCLIIEQYVKNEINKNLETMLIQSENNIELMFGEIDYLFMVFGINKDVTLQIKRILNSTYFSLEDIWQLNMFKNVLNSISYSKPFIHSIYVYFKNPEGNFIVTPDGITNFQYFYDKRWFEQYKKHGELMWIERRKIQPYNFTEESIDVLTIYKKIMSGYSDLDEGVIVLNLYYDQVKKLLNLPSSIPEHAMYILDQKGNILVSNQSDDSNILSIISKKPAKNFLTKRIVSKKYNLIFVSVIPKDYLYSIPIKLFKIAIVMLLIFVIIAFSASYYIAKVNYRNIKKIIDTINSATEGKPLKEADITSNDEYGYIMYNVIKNFIEKHYLTTRLQALELLALQSQINPHFLFNTLEHIYLKTLALTGSPNEVTKMIENLSSILKYSLSNPRITIFLKDEIKATKAYIDLVKARYKEKFDVFWDYSEDVLDIKVMKLLFQPLIENSIYHGIKPCEKRCGIKIRIRKSKDTSDWLCIWVIDNGIGMSKEKLEEIQSRLLQDFDFSDHIGLLNTNERLKLIYGNNFKLKVWSKLGLGTVVKIILPVDFEDRKENG
ncbi:sensor histidine kinase [Anaerocellum diazotrophicum]|uniref:Signal transduction histidine kinase, LytS n=1 Tax=Caldicellulosiruptor diazotrophicus TaxID=2806205 RepID=A0ABN6E4C2_9FIRM|nr:sensor histidine kinase [Caldicellulosiruptor diazotrophicus]BCS80176.1 hypothetical protein CaldiYA01_01360 [Caldicellulosiruptor diazotrophicus]